MTKSTRPFEIRTSHAEHAAKENAWNVTYPPLTREQALTVSEVHASGQFDRKGNCRVWRRNGSTQTWKSKKNAERFRLPVKYGLFAYDAITEHDTHAVHAPEDCPFATDSERASIKQARANSIAHAQRRERFDKLVKDGAIFYDKGVTNWWVYTDKAPEGFNPGQPYEQSRENLTGWPEAT